MSESRRWAELRLESARRYRKAGAPEMAQLAVMEAMAQATGERDQTISVMKVATIPAGRPE